MWGRRGLSCAARVLLGVPRAAGGWTSGRRPLQPGEWRRAAGCPAGKRAGLRSENVPSPFWRSPRPRCAAGEAPFLARKAWRTAARESGRAGAGERASGSCVNVIFRNLDTAADCSLSYKELKSLLKSRTTLIDVREKWEIGQFGKIPGSVNIPLGEVVEALQMNPKDFKERYNQDMPAKSDHLVFSCMAGVRSKKALDIAMSLGFSRVQHYAGGLEEWAKYESPEKKQSR